MGAAAAGAGVDCDAVTGAAAAGAGAAWTDSSSGGLDGPAANAPGAASTNTAARYANEMTPVNNLRRTIMLPFPQLETKSYPTKQIGLILESPVPRVKTVTMDERDVMTRTIDDW